MTTQTIPADDFGLDGDRAWWITGDGGEDVCARLGDSFLKVRIGRKDRPCDTCDGKGWQTCAEGAERCEDCFETGRHTWNIHVECSEPDIARYEDQGWHNGPSCAARNCEDGVIEFRVSVVPGMVLPIVDYRSNETGFDRLKLGPEGFGYPATLMRAKPSDDDLRLINLPDGKKPGRFAVLLNVEPVTIISW